MSELENKKNKTYDVLSEVEDTRSLREMLQIGKCKDIGHDYRAVYGNNVIFCRKCGDIKRLPPKPAEKSKIVKIHGKRGRPRKYNNKLR